MPLTLAFDTSAEACSVALLRNGAALAEEREYMARGHAEALIPMVNRVVHAADESLSAIEIVGVVAGPGSFTGLRAGIAAARGFALASRARAVGVSAFEAVALRALEDTGRRASILCVLETRRSDYFAQGFDVDGTALTTASVMTSGEIGERLSQGGCVLAGNAAQRLASELSGAGVACAPGDGLPVAADVARLADRAGGPDPVPLYLRAPEARRPDGGFRG